MLIDVISRTTMLIFQSLHITLLQCKLASDYYCLITSITGNQTTDYRVSLQDVRERKSGTQTLMQFVSLLLHPIHSFAFPFSSPIYSHLSAQRILSHIRRM